MIAVTGATGFVGRQLVRLAGEKSIPVRSIVRKGAQVSGESFEIDDILSESSWKDSFKGTQTSIHLLALAHGNFSAEYIDAVNHRAARAAAIGAKAAGVRKFILVSSTHVFGSDSSPHIVSDDHTRNPQTAYARAKCKAEDAILAMARDFPDGVVVARPPLVYGPNPKGNVLRLIKAIELGVPLPVRSWPHRRTMVGTENLSDALLTVAARPIPSGAYIICDANSLTLAESIASLAKGLDRDVHLFSCPLSLMRAFRFLPKIGGLIDKLTGPMQYDGTRFCQALAWHPPRSPEEGLIDSARSVR